MRFQELFNISQVIPWQVILWGALYFFFNLTTGLMGETII